MFNMNELVDYILFSNNCTYLLMTYQGKVSSDVFYHIANSYSDIILYH